MQEILLRLQELPALLLGLAEAWPQAVRWFFTLDRFLFPILALLILVRAIRGLLRIPHTGEQWGQLALPGGGSIPIQHWENTIGRAPLADIRLDLPTVSRQHAALLRTDRGDWQVTDLDSKGGTLVNGVPVTAPTPIKLGDTLSVGGVPLLFLPLSQEEEAALAARRKTEAPLSMWPSFLWLTLFQILTALQLLLRGGEAVGLAPLMLPCLTAVMWLYCLILRGAGARGFELETIAFFLSTLSLAVTCSSAPGAVFKQFIAIVLGLLFLIALGVLMRDAGRIHKLRWLMGAMAMGLLSVTLFLGQTKFGAANWIILGPLSFQPSEVAKIFYIFAGAASLERLFRKRNLGLFMAMTGFCLLCLALMSDFGTACIFFATFLVIAYLRSGDFATLSLLCGGALFAGLLVLKFKPYIFRRFASWGHAWEAASTTGYQQTRTMSAAASGGLVGVGAGNGWLHKLPAADTDLVFGMLCEEWGLLIAVLAVLSIVTLAVFAARTCRVGRSAFPTIAACAAGSLLVVQTSLNVFGAMDLLPLTGVTFPFVSNGGSAMMASWGLLAFLKATDTRAGASFAIRSGKKKRRPPAMKKLERRALLCLVLAGFLLAGLALFLFRFAADGSRWASSPFNRHLYNSDGQLISGTVLDRDGEVLSTVDKSGRRTYTDGKNRRKAVLHVVGDPSGNIGTGALSAFARELTGYSLLGGAYGAEEGGGLYLTIDADLNETAYKALNGRKGTVAVYNYQTGEILCLVSAPSYDPRNVPGDLNTNEKYEGVYLNRFLSSTFTPGSVFKLVTLTAALEKIPDLEDRTWTCQGAEPIGDGVVTCTAAHGEQDIADALANSCNAVFGRLAVELGGKTLEQYAKKAGLTSSYSVSGIPTAKGSFSLGADLAQIDLAWAGVGQYHDSVNPCALMVYMGAIANGGKAATPCLIQKVERPGLPDFPQFTRKTKQLIQPDTARTVADLMANNVTESYGTKRFPNMDLCAKSGTAEVGEDRKPHAWFTGFLRNEDTPYAFVVLVENGGSGAKAAGDVASNVLKAAVQ